jgi:hypothetical protein
VCAHPGPEGGGGDVDNRVRVLLVVEGSAGL